jgi:protein-tyrosine phosphatase
MPSILFVCTANQFRSPLAAALLIKLIGTDNCTDGWRVESAGTWTKPGLPASSLAVRVAQRLDLPGLKAHLTRQVNRELLDQYDLILMMERGQLEAIASEFKTVSSRTMLLSEIIDGLPYDIPDPVGFENAPEEVASELQMLIERGGQKILKMAESFHNKRIILGGSES